MGRRAKRPSREIALRMRMEALPAPLRTSLPTPNETGNKAGMRRTDAVTEWAMRVFMPKHGRAPSEVELCQAVDSGAIGRWYAEQTSAKVIKREILMNGKPVNGAALFAKSKPAKDMRYAEETAKQKKAWREKRWRQESESEAIAAAMAGKLDKVTPESLETEAQRLYADKVRRWEIEQIFKANSRKGKRRR